MSRMSATSGRTVLLLRRAPESLLAEEVAQLERAFPGVRLDLVRTDPRNYQEHLADCERLSPIAVVVPGERPIPSAAMDRGFVHVHFSGTGLVEVVSLRAEVRPFRFGG